MGDEEGEWQVKRREFTGKVVNGVGSSIKKSRIQDFVFAHL
jgi:hypothetical protein